MTDPDWAHERATKIFEPGTRGYLTEKQSTQWHAEVAEALREERAQARKKLAEEIDELLPWEELGVSDLLDLSDLLGKART